MLKFIVGEMFKKDVEEKKKSIEKTAKKWWDFTRNKLKMIRWLKKKEGDAATQTSTSCRIDSAQDQLTAYQVWVIICFHLVRNQSLKTVQFHRYSKLTWRSLSGRKKIIYLEAKLTT